MRQRAIVFDLDDTLYRERRFALSGYRAVSRSIERDLGIARRDAFRALALALRRGRRATAFQDLAVSLGLSGSDVPAWIACYRAHAPDLRLAPGVRRMLERLRQGWRIGVLTNGLAAVQAAKIDALGLRALVDAVVYADAFGGGKPHPAAFREVLERLGAAPNQAVFAGDDPARDIDGARLVGMKTVWVDHGPRRGDCRLTPTADAVVSRVSEVPAAAERLLGEEPGHVH